MIGRKGKRACPPQFQYPSSVAVDRALGNIYVADYGNARIQILEVNGNMAREPLVLGGKCRPCALAVSLRGDLVMTDSQILRVFSKTGELTRQSCVSYPDLLIKESVDVQSTTTTMKRQQKREARNLKSSGKTATLHKKAYQVKLYKPLPS